MRLRLPRLPNRWRITGWIVASVLVVTFLVGLITVDQVRNRFTEQLDDDLRAQAAGLTTALEVIGPDGLERLADQAPELSDATYGVTLIRPSGEVVVVPAGPSDDPDPPIDTSRRAASTLRGQAGEPFDLRSADGSETYRAMVGQADDGGLIVVTRSLDDRDAAVRTVVRVLVLTGLIAAALISVTVAVVSALVTRPLDAMIDAAEAIGEGDLTSRVPTSGVEDVTRLATALNHMLDRLEQAFVDKQVSEDALRRFVADASHELRTPLAAILGYAELHQSGMADDRAATDRAMERIRAEGERMRVLVEELLTLARLDEGRPMEDTDVDLGDLVRVATADAAAIDPDRTVEVSVPGGPVVVPGDPLSLRQAVDNLLTNARTHTPPDASITVTVRRDGDEARVEVHDEGPGLAPGDAAHVFDRFYRIDQARSRTGPGAGGAGLGLAIVAAIAEAHDGTATVTSSPGEGSTFTLSLPTR